MRLEMVDDFQLALYSYLALPRWTADRPERRSHMAECQDSQQESERLPRWMNGSNRWVMGRKEYESTGHPLDSRHPETSTG